MLPVPSNQKLNAYLKEIGELCGIEKELTYHLDPSKVRPALVPFTVKTLSKSICG